MMEKRFKRLKAFLESVELGSNDWGYNQGARAVIGSLEQLQHASESGDDDTLICVELAGYIGSLLVILEDQAECPDAAHGLRLLAQPIFAE